MLARTSCHSGKFRLQSGRAGSLYLALGLLLSGHGESVVALRSTTISSVLSSSSPKVVRSPKVRCISRWSRSLSNLKR